jgi:alpha-glucosidase
MGSFSLKEMVAVTRSLGTGSILNRLRYPLRQRLYEARCRAGPEAGTRLSTVRALLRRRRPAEDHPLGGLLTFRRAGQALDLMCTNGVLRLEVLAGDLVPFSYALDPKVEWAPVTFDVEETHDELIIRTGRLVCRVSKVPCRLSFYDPEGRLLSQNSGLGFRGEGTCDRGAYCLQNLVEGEAIYGLGERAFELNLRGRRLEMWNRDPESYGPGVDPIHMCIPTLVALREGRAYGFFFDNPGRARFDLGQTRPDQLRYETDTGELCAYFFAGPSMADVLARYTQLTGRMSLPPRWMLGYQQSRWSYYPERRVRALAAEFRQRCIPCDVIHLDIHYLDGYRVFTWDRQRFPDPPGLLADLHAMGFRTITMIDPGVKVDPGYSVHDEGLAGDMFLKMPDGRLFEGPVWPGQCYFPDFTDPRVRAWWGELYEPLLAMGVDGFWNDMNEPAIFGGPMPGTVCHDYDGHGASHEEIHNVYGLQMARAGAEGLRRLCPDERVPLFIRSGYAGLQRFALMWTGDNLSTWAHLRLGVSMCLNLGLSGLAFCGPDVGGFAGDCDGELLARWTQVGVLTPFFRNHSTIGSRYQEPWAFGEPYESICRRWIEFRYELLPYLYTAFWQASRTGLPIMRPLSLAYPEDIRTYSLDDQFLLGDALLAAPVTRAGQRSRRVYLPGGTWYDFWTGRRYDDQGTGGRSVTADAPLERMPLYVRAGSVLPLGPVLQHTGEWPPDALQLHIYPGEGESWLYEDDGHSLAYQSGEMRLTRFVCEVGVGDEAPGPGLAVHREVQGPFDPGYQRFEIYIHGLEASPEAVQVAGHTREVTFDAGTRTAYLAAGPWQRLTMQ